MEDKIGVFICTGYGIGEALDIDALCKVATDEYDLALCKTVESCEGPGLQSINEDIKNDGLTKVVIAGISPRRYAEDAFPANVIVEKIALREQVVWTQPPGEEDTQMLAEDYLRMYITKLQKMEPLVPFQPEEAIDKSILVVGGGIAGLQTALDLADQNFKVAVVEKDATIGGKMIRLSKVFPTLDCPICITTPKMASAAHHDNISIFTYCDVSAIDRDGGGIVASLTQRPRYVDPDKCIGCGECILIGPSEAELFGDVFGGVTHMAVVERTPQAALDQGSVIVQSPIMLPT